MLKKHSLKLLTVTAALALSATVLRAADPGGSNRQSTNNQGALPPSLPDVPPGGPPGVPPGGPSGVPGNLPSQTQLQTALKSVVTAGSNGGFGLQMWATIVNRDGIVGAVAFSGNERGDQWPGSRVISAQKANTANAFSLKGLALSTANLYSAVQPGGSLFGLQESNPVPRWRTVGHPRITAKPMIQWSARRSAA